MSRKTKIHGPLIPDMECRCGECIIFAFGKFWDHLYFSRQCKDGGTATPVKPYVRRKL